MDALGGAAKLVEHAERMRDAAGLQQAVDHGRRRSTGREHQKACAGLQIGEDRLDRPAAAGQAFGVLQCPAEPGGGTLERRRRRQDTQPPERHVAQQQARHPEPQRVARREHRDRPVVRYHPRHARLDRAGPGEGFAMDEPGRQRKMPRPADDEASRPNRLGRLRHQHAVLVDADDGDGCSAHRHPRNPFTSSPDLIRGSAAVGNDAPPTARDGRVKPGHDVCRDECHCDVRRNSSTNASNP